MKTINRLILCILTSIAFNSPVIGTLQAGDIDFLLGENKKLPNMVTALDKWQAEEDKRDAEFAEYKKSITKADGWFDLDKMPELSEKSRRELDASWKRGETFTDISESWRKLHVMKIWLFSRSWFPSPEEMSKPDLPVDAIFTPESICSGKTTELQLMLEQIKELNASFAADEYICQLDIDELHAREDSSLKGYGEQSFRNLVQVMIMYKDGSMQEKTGQTFAEFFEATYRKLIPAQEPMALENYLANMSAAGSAVDLRAFCGNEENFNSGYNRGNMTLDIVFKQIKDTLSER